LTARREPNPWCNEISGNTLIAELQMPIANNEIN
jgi:hypothetical protein